MCVETGHVLEEVLNRDQRTARPLIEPSSRRRIASEKCYADDDSRTHTNNQCQTKSKLVRLNLYRNLLFILAVQFLISHPPATHALPLLYTTTCTMCDEENLPEPRWWNPCGHPNTPEIPEGDVGDGEIVLTMDNISQLRRAISELKQVAANARDFIINKEKIEGLANSWDDSNHDFTWLPVIPKETSALTALKPAELLGRMHDDLQKYAAGVECVLQDSADRADSKRAIEAVDDQLNSVLCEVLSLLLELNLPYRKIGRDVIEERYRRLANSMTDRRVRDFAVVHELGVGAQRYEELFTILENPSPNNPSP